MAELPGNWEGFQPAAPETFRFGSFDQGPAAPVDLSPRPFRFTGTAGEYFRIWIVNLFLSVVTLGIYSAWAKVRRLRYFYGHTSLDGSSFGYHASPMAILKGRLVAYAVVVVLAILSQAAPLVAALLYVPLIGMMPIVIVRALGFRARNTSYRGIRFAFDGEPSEAFGVFLGLPLAVPFTLGLSYPYVMKRQREFIVQNMRHGQSMFQLPLPTGAVYRIYLVAALCGIAVFGLPVAMLGGSEVAGAVAASGDEPAPVDPQALLAVLLLYAGIGAVAVGVRTASENLVWNHTTIDGHRFDSRLGIFRMFAIYITNVLAIGATLGLAVPWARIRLARYRAASLTLLPAGPLLAHAAGLETDDSAAGAELSEAMDFDVGV